MRKKLSISLLLTAIALCSYAIQDSIGLADYEPNSAFIMRTYSWTDSDISVVANPDSNAINGSDSVLKFIRSTQYSSAVGLNNFGNVSLFQRPLIKLKVRSDSTVSKVIQIQVTDVNGFKTIAQGTMPNQDSTWEDITIDFTGKLKTTPISFVNTIEIQINYGQAVPSGATKNIYYIDDIRFAGEPADITENDTLVIFQEAFSSNAWFLTDRGNGIYYDDNTLGYFRTAEYSNSALTGGADHYNSTDSLRMIMTNWSGVAKAELFPSATRAGLSKLEIINLDIIGKGNLDYSYDLQWIDAPASFSDAPAIEYQLDGGSWTALSTSSTLPSAIGIWDTLIYPLTGISGDTVNLRVTNNTTAKCYIDNLTFTGKLVFADSIKIFASDDSIKVNTGTVQLTDTVYPLNANQAVEWSIVGGTGMAELVDTAEGLVKGIANGTVLVRARALDVWGEVSDTITIYMVNQNPVDSISVTADTNVITVDGGTLLMTAEVFPFNSAAAFDSTVTWSTSSTIATVNDTGLVTAVGNGQVGIIATANDGSGVADTMTITISNQIAEFPIETIVFGTVDSAADFTGKVSMLWDADSIYLAFDITDDSIVSTGTNYQVDNIEIYLDIDNSKNIHWPRNQGWISNDPTFDTNDYQLRLVPDTAFAKNNSLKGVRQVYTKTTTGYKFELNIVWDSLLVGFVPGVDTLIGFDVLVSDNDAVASDANRNQITMNSPTDKPFNDPSLWATLQLDAGNVFSNIPDETAPSIPASVAATATKADVKVTWAASTDNIGVLSYIILKGGTAVDTIYAVASDNSYTDAGLANGSYTYSVIAIDNSGNVSDTSATASATVNYVAVTGITVGGGTGIDTKGGTLQMTVTVTPTDATDKSVTWGVSDENIATIDDNGLLTAVSNGTVTVTATSKDVTTISGTADVVISGQVGIDEPVTIEFTAYPNPASEVVMISSTTGIESIEIINLIGQSLISLDVRNSNTIEVNVANLHAGVYFVKLQVAGQTSVQRLIIE